MKKCRNIRRDLSAYIDDELAPARRSLVSSHLETCAQCRQELSELEKVTNGVAALPRLQPAPRFLMEIRRKIVKGEDPEATTLLEHLFQPFWLKVPLEIAALVLVVGLVMRVEHPVPTQPLSENQLASEADNNNNRPDAAPQNEDAKAVTDEAKPMAPEPAAATEEARGEQLQVPVLGESEQKSAPATESPSVASANSEPRSTVDNPTVAQGNSGGGSQQPASAPQRSAAASRDGLSYQSARSSAPPLGIFQSAGLAPSKPREQVTVQSRDFASVRGRAEQLAARCNGKVLGGNRSTDGAEQILLVEVPREYAAAFKVELSRTTTSVAPISPGGVLTGTAATNDVIGNLTSSVSGNQDTLSSTEIVEIHVVAPAN